MSSLGPKQSSKQEELLQLSNSVEVEMEMALKTNDAAAINHRESMEIPASDIENEEEPFVSAAASSKVRAHFGVRLSGQFASRNRPEDLAAYLRMDHIKRSQTRQPRDSGNHLGAPGSRANGRKHGHVAQTLAERQDAIKQLLRLPAVKMIDRLDEVKFKYRCVRHLHNHRDASKQDCISFSLQPKDVNGRLYLRLGSYLKGQVSDYTIELGNEIKFFIGQELRKVTKYKRSGRKETERGVSGMHANNLYMSGTFDVHDAESIHTVDTGNYSRGGGSAAGSGGTAGTAGMASTGDTVVTVEEKKDDDSVGHQGRHGRSGSVGGPVARMGTSYLNENAPTWFRLSWKKDMLMIHESKSFEEDPQAPPLLKQTIISDSIHWIGFAYVGQGVFEVESEEMSKDIFKSWEQELAHHESDFKQVDIDNSQFIDEKELEGYVQWNKTDVKKFLSEHGGKDSQLTLREFLQIMLENQDIHRVFVLDALPGTMPLGEVKELKTKLKILLSVLNPRIKIVPSLSTRGFRALQISLEKYIPTEFFTDGIAEAAAVTPRLRSHLPPGYVIEPQVTYNNLRLISIPVLPNSHAGQGKISAEQKQQAGLGNFLSEDRFLKNFGLDTCKVLAQTFPAHAHFKMARTHTIFVKLPKEVPFDNIVDFNQALIKKLAKMTNGEKPRIYVFPAFELDGKNSENLKISGYYVKNQYHGDMASVTSVEYLPLWFRHVPQRSNKLGLFYKQQSDSRPVEEKGLRELDFSPSSDDAGDTADELDGNESDAKIDRTPSKITRDPTQFLRTVDKVDLDRLVYFEIQVRSAGQSKDITIGATDDANFPSDARPGTTLHSYGFSGHDGHLRANDQTDQHAGRKLGGANEYFGCGFVIRPRSQKDLEDDDGSDPEGPPSCISNLFFTRTAQGSQRSDFVYYPDKVRKGDRAKWRNVPKQLLATFGRNVVKSLFAYSELHRFFACASLKSENASIRFNFGPKFDWGPANEFVRKTYGIRSQLSLRMDNSNTHAPIMSGASLGSAGSGGTSGPPVRPQLSNLGRASRMTQYDAEEDQMMLRERLEAERKQRFDIAVYLFLTPLKMMDWEQVKSLLLDAGWDRVSQEVTYRRIDGQQLYELDHDTLKRVFEMDEKLTNRLENEIQRWGSIEVYSIEKLAYTQLPDDVLNVIKADDVNLSNSLILETWNYLVEGRCSQRLVASEVSQKLEYLLDAMAFYMTYDLALQRMERVFYEIVHYRKDDALNSFSPLQELTKLCSGVIAGSKNPVSTALQLAAYLKGVKDQFPEIEDLLTTLSDICQDMAAKFMDRFHSDRLAMLALESNAALDIALTYNLQRFVQHPRVQHMRNLAWTQHRLMESCVSEDYAEKSELYSWAVAFWQAVHNPRQWFFSPIGKFQMVTYFALIYLVILCILAIQHRTVYTPRLTLMDWLFWLCNAAIVSRELRSMWTSGFERYLKSWINYVDAAVAGMLFALFALRVYGYYATPDDSYGKNQNVPCLSKAEYDEYVAGLDEGEDPALEKCVDDENELRTYYDTTANMAYFGILAIIIILYYIRVNNLFLIFHSMGPLVRSLGQMAQDVFNLILFFCVMMFGFTLALILITSQEAVNFDTMGSAIKFVFAIFLGELSWNDLIETDVTWDNDDYVEGEPITTENYRYDINEMSDERQTMFELLIYACAIFGSVVLLTLAVAVLSKSYESVLRQAKVYVAFHRMDQCRIHQTSIATLPVPFSLVVYVGVIIWYLVEWTLFFLFGVHINEERLIAKKIRDSAVITYDRKRATAEDKQVTNYTAQRRPYLVTPDSLNIARAIRSGYSYNLNASMAKRFNNYLNNRSFCAKVMDRFTCVRYVWQELVTVLMPPEDSVDATVPIIWICSYCRHHNNETRRRARQDKLPDFEYYNVFNGKNNPPDYAFSSSDVNFIRRIDPQICDFCFRARHWKHRVQVIEETIAFYIWYFVVRIVTIPVWLVYKPFSVCFDSCTPRAVAQLGLVLTSGSYEVVFELKQKLTDETKKDLREFIEKTLEVMDQEEVTEVMNNLVKFQSASVYRGSARKCRSLRDNIVAKYDKLKQPRRFGSSMRRVVTGAGFTGLSAANVSNGAENTKDVSGGDKTHSQDVSGQTYMLSEGEYDDDEGFIDFHDSELDGTRRSRDRFYSTSRARSQHGMKSYANLVNKLNLPDMLVRVKNKRWKMETRTILHKERDKHVLSMAVQATQQIQKHDKMIQGVIDETIHDFKYQKTGLATKSTDELVQELRGRVEYIAGDSQSIRNTVEKMQEKQEKQLQNLKRNRGTSVASESGDRMRSGTGFSVEDSVEPAVNGLNGVNVSISAAVVPKSKVKFAE